MARHHMSGKRFGARLAAHVTGDELRLIQRAAAVRGMTLREFARQSLVMVAGQTVARPRFDLDPYARRSDVETHRVATPLEKRETVNERLGAVESTSSTPRRRRGI